MLSHNALSCDCVAPDIKVFLGFSSSVFIGEVKSSNSSTYASDQEITFIPSEIYKGEKEKKKVIWARKDAAACGINVKPKEEYLVFTNLKNNKITSGACTMFLINESKQYIKELNQLITK